MKSLMKLLIKDYENSENPETREKCGRVAGLVGIAANFFLFVIKLAAGLISNSVAIIADSINSLSDSASSLITAVGFKLAAKPADEKHPFGHARLEYITGIAVSFLVLFFGIEMAVSSVKKIISPEESSFGPVSLIVLCISVLVKLWLGFLFKEVGRHINSQTLSAASQDSRNDVISTLAVLSGALISRIFGVNLDGFLGLAVAVFIFVSGIRLIIDTSQPLLGVAPNREFVRHIYEKILSYKGIVGLHDLTVHSYGPGRCFASVHCEVPAETDIMVSHDIIDNIERDFLKDENIHLVIHLDPIVTNDPRIDELRKKVAAAVKTIYNEAGIHDFRVVWGITHSNVIFDVVVPFSVSDSDETVRKRISHAVQLIDESLRTVITVDRGSFVNDLET